MATVAGTAAAAPGARASSFGHRPSLPSDALGSRRAGSLASWAAKNPTAPFECGDPFFCRLLTFG